MNQPLPFYWSGIKLKFSGLTTLGTAIREVMSAYSTYLLTLAAMGIHFCQFSVYSFAPKFYSDVYQMNLTKNRFVSVLPILCSMCGAPTGGFLVDFLRRRFSFQNSMKIVHSLETVVPTAHMLILAFVTGLPFAAVVECRISKMCNYQKASVVPKFGSYKGSIFMLKPTARSENSLQNLTPR